MEEAGDREQEPAEPSSNSITLPIPNPPKKRSADSMASSDSIQDLIAKAKKSRTQAPPPPQLSGNKQQALEDSLEKELTCSICTEIAYRPVAVLDCLHTFCGSCIKPWLERSLRCPNCRAKIKKCKEDHKQRNLVELFLKSHPDKEMDTEEKKERDKVYTAGEKLDVSRDLERENDFDDDEEDDMDSSDYENDIVYHVGRVHNLEPCPTCAPPDPNPYGYTCPRPIQPGVENRGLHLGANGHVLCSICRGLVPTGLVDRMRCGHCNVVICGTIFEGRCTATQDEWLKEFKEVDLKCEGGHYEPYFSGNSVESASFDAWKTENQVSDEEIGKRVREWILQMHDNQSREFDFDRFLGISCAMCKACVRICFGVYFIRWWIYERERVGLTQNDARPRCWYGRNCRTQRHNQDHNRRLQHMCEEIPPSERRNIGPPRPNPQVATQSLPAADGASGGN